MKKRKSILTIVSILLSIPVIAQWEWQNPLPQGQNLYSIAFIDANEGWAGGENSIIIHTADGGASWEYQSVGEISIFYDLDFIDGQTGIAVGGYPFCDRKILKTTNGGSDWTEVLGYGTNPLYDLFILDQDTCIVVGANGELLRSDDGGDTWQGYSTGFDEQFRSCWFANSGQGWIVGEEGTILRQTADNVWIKIDTLTDLDLYSIYFMDEHYGLICGEHGTVFRTEDGGSSWERVPSLPDKILRHIDFCSKDRGWVTGGVVLYTTDAGKTWETQQASGVSASHPTCETGYTAGAGGNLFRTDDGGNEWTEISSGYHGQITDICFIDESRGWAFENGYPVNTLLHTDNGGLTWNRIDTSNIVFHSLCFLDDQHGWAAGSYEILYTSNGGYDWVVQQPFSPEGSFEDIYFADPDHGWAIIQADTVYRTTNGGITWEAIGVPSFGLQEIFFIDQNTGWIVGYMSNILKTTDGGLTWTDIAPGDRYAEYKSVCFTDHDKGWVVGEDNVILHTGDGGETWEYQSEEYPRTLYSVTFTDSLYGWISASYGAIFHTVDGGLNWAKQESYCWNYLFKICFTDQNNGWAAGQYGTIMHTSNGGMVGIKEIPVNSSSLITANFPNPLKYSTTIEYELLDDGLVTIHIYNNLGQHIEKLLQEEQLCGKHDISWDAFTYPPGIYYYSINANNTISTGKMLVAR